jgi:uncharacterized membrane protein
MTRAIRNLLFAGAAALSLAACNTPSEQVGGAAAGAVVGGAVAGPVGAVVGGVGGAVVGPTVARHMGIPHRRYYWWHGHRRYYHRHAPY